jgi:hypothetical protein
MSGTTTPTGSRPSTPTGENASDELLSGVAFLPAPIVPHSPFMPPGSPPRPGSPVVPPISSSGSYLPELSQQACASTLLYNAGPPGSRVTQPSGQNPVPRVQPPVPPRLPLELPPVPLIPRANFIPDLSARQLLLASVLDWGSNERHPLSLELLQIMVGTLRHQFPAAGNAYSGQWQLREAAWRLVRNYPDYFGAAQDPGSRRWTFWAKPRP